MLLKANIISKNEKKDNIESYTPIMIQIVVYFCSEAS